MKRILTICMGLGILLLAKAQIPEVPEAVCAHCGVLMTHNHKLMEGVQHKKGCPYYEEPSSEESSSSSTSSSTTTSKPSRPFNERTDVSPDEYGRGSYKCPECDNLYHTSSCQLGKVQSEYRKLHNEIRFGDKKWKKKAYREALDRREQLWSELKRCINDAWWKKDHPSYTSSSSSTTSQPSTHLADYTPAPEHPMVSKPLIDMPTCQPMPQFSSINESNIRYEKPMALTGKHEWGEIDEAATLAYFKKINKGRPTAWKDLEYDIERYNHEGGPVIIGIHQANGRYLWFVFVRQSNGKYAPVDDGLNRQTEILDDGHGRDVKAQTVDVRYEGQGKFVIREWEGGYKHIYNSSGNIITTGYNVRLMNKMVDGKQLVYSEPDPDDEGGHCSIIDENAHTVAFGNHLETYDDAIVQMDNSRDGGKIYSMVNWSGKELRIEGTKFFEEIKAYNNEGSYYILKDKFYNKGYAVIGRGFKRVGGWYETEEEAHRAWRDYHPRP